MHDPAVNKDTVRYGLVGEGGVPLVTFWWEDQNGRVNKIRLQGPRGKVLRIEINLDYDLALGEIVGEYGPPETVYVPVCAEDYSERVFIDYPSVGIQFLAPLPADAGARAVESSVVLSETLVMTDAVYFAPTSFQEMLSEVFRLSPAEVDCRVSHSHQWQGFGRLTIEKP
jgi:hypothetical protein